MVAAQGVRILRGLIPLQCCSRWPAVAPQLPISLTIPSSGLWPAAAQSNTPSWLTAWPPPPGIRSSSGPQRSPDALQVRTHSSAPLPPLYPEQQQLRDIKPAEFYNSEARKHRYFYFVDLQGRLFTEDTVPKTMATALKAQAAVDYFFKMLQRNETGLHEEYPFVSPCGSWETNFIKAAATPAVFVTLQQPETCEASVRDELVYGSSLTVPFDPAELRLCTERGMLFHRLRTKRIDTMALLRSQLTQHLSAHVELFDSPKGEVVGEFEWRGSLFPLRRISGGA